MSRNKVLVLILLVVMLFSLGACSSTPNSPSSATRYTPGTYTAKGNGMNGDVEISVILSENAITNIQIGKNHETFGISDKSLNDLPKAIIAKHSLEVDTVAGATVSSLAIINAVADCVKQAGGDVSALKIAKPKQQKKLEETADVIVVGGGGAGTVAAITAAEAGASVIIVEKADYLGGNTRVSGGIYNTANPERQNKVKMTDSLKKLVNDALAEKPANEQHAQLIADVKKDYDKFVNEGSNGLFDSPAWHALQTYNGGDKIGNVELIRTLTGNALDSLHWLMSIGVEYKAGIDQAGGAMYQRTHRPVGVLGSSYFKAYDKQLNKYADKVKIIYHTEGKKLLMDGDKVVGVYAKDRDGNEYTFYANKAVILATGGFASNVKLRQEYCEGEKWPDLGLSLKSTNLSTVKGDGIFMARDVGANLVDMDQIQLLHSACLRNGQADWALNYTVNSSLFINKEGKRFIREDARRDELCLAIFKQTDKMMYILQSGETFPNPNEVIMHGGVPLADCIATGDAFVGDTLDDLAKQLGMSADVLKKTVTDYNAAFTAGKDVEFGRSLFKTKLEKGPWYALPRAPSAHHTMGGVQIDSRGHVLNTKGEIIKGLFAAGEVTGGIHGGNRLGGNAVLDTVVFGRIAGKNAAGGQ